MTMISARRSMWACAAILLASASWANPAVADASENETAALNLIKNLILDHTPRSLEEKDNWGKTVRIFNGVKWSGQGFKVRPSVQKKDVNHGLWRHYKIVLENPDDLSVAIREVVKLDNGRTRFRVVVRAKVKGWAHVIQYANGVKWLSVDTEAYFQVDASFICEAKIKVSGAGFFSSLSIDPKVLDADILLRDIETQKIGHLKGDPAQELGDHFRRLIEKKLQGKEDKMVEKANKEIEKLKKDDKLTLSLANWLLEKVR